MSQYRYSLRNQKKIGNALGKDFLQLLLDSLNAYFKDRTENVPEVGEFKNGKDTGRRYILIETAAHNSETYFQFVILSKTYTVYNLAYYNQLS